MLVAFLVSKCNAQLLPSLFWGDQLFPSILGTSTTVLPLLSLGGNTAQSPTPAAVLLWDKLAPMVTEWDLLLAFGG